MLSPSSQYSSPLAFSASFNDTINSKLFSLLSVVVAPGFCTGRIEPPRINNGILSIGAGNV